jgi:hypothetical protein
MREIVADPEATKEEGQLFFRGELGEALWAATPVTIVA